MICNLCPKRCNAIRTDSANINGFCQMPLNPRVARADLHFWEEPSISGTRGSGAVFFSGCSLSCVFCQNYDISHKNSGKTIDANQLAQIFRDLENKGAHNINLVTPSHYAQSIVDALKIYKPKIPVIYNSSGYDNTETLKMLEGYIDIYLMDLKYLSSDRSQRYSSASDYPQVAMSAIKEAYRQQKQCVFKEGIMQKGVIIRHLLLPQGTKEAIKVFDWVRENTPDSYFSIMSQYLPLGNAKSYKEINRKVTKREYNKVLDYICGFDFPNVYIQDNSSANSCFIPDFNLKD